MSEKKNGKQTAGEKETNTPDKNIPKREKPVVSRKFLVTYALFFLGLFCFTLFDFLISGIPWDTPVDPEIVNGILTVTALIFGFSTFGIELRNLGEPHRSWLWFIFATQAMIIAAAALFYFSDFINHRNTTCLTLMASMVALIYNMVTMVFTKFLYESTTVAHSSNLKERDDLCPKT